MNESSYCVKLALKNLRHESAAIVELTRNYKENNSATAAGTLLGNKLALKIYLLIFIIVNMFM